VPRPTGVKIETLAAFHVGFVTNAMAAEIVRDYRSLSREKPLPALCASAPCIVKSGLSCHGLPV
jgi:hypothetical protein